MQRRIQTELLSEYVKLLEEIKKLTQEGEADKGEELEILAGEFNVEPRKLLSHVLIYSIDL